MLITMMVKHERWVDCLRLFSTQHNLRNILSTGVVFINSLNTLRTTLNTLKYTMDFLNTLDAPRTTLNTVTL